MNTPVWQTFEAIKSSVPGRFFRYGHFSAGNLNKRRKDLVFCRALPAGAGLLVGFSIPDRVMEGKHPQFLSR